MTRLADIPSGWLTTVAKHNLTTCDDVHGEARRNTLIFPLAEAYSAFPNPDLTRFLMEAFHAFRTKAVGLGFKGWFYAWFDEVSGTLRCSACRVTSSAALPFSCAFDVVATPREVARAVENSRYIAGIPAGELLETDFDDKTPDHSNFTLTVFARPLDSE